MQFHIWLQWVWWTPSACPPNSLLSEFHVPPCNRLNQRSVQTTHFGLREQVATRWRMKSEVRCKKYANTIKEHPRFQIFAVDHVSPLKVIRVIEKNHTKIDCVLSKIMMSTTKTFPTLTMIPRFGRNDIFDFLIIVSLLESDVKELRFWTLFRVLIGRYTLVFSNFQKSVSKSWPSQTACWVYSFDDHARTSESKRSLWNPYWEIGSDRVSSLAPIGMDMFYGNFRCKPNLPNFVTSSKTDSKVPAAYPKFVKNQSRNKDATMCGQRWDTSVISTIL